jgi:hypothetical protein
MTDMEHGTGGKEQGGRVYPYRFIEMKPIFPEKTRPAGAAMRFDQRERYR